MADDGLLINAEEVKKSAIKGGRALVIRHLAGFAVNFSGTVYLARTLGPEALGLFFISFTLYMILRQLIDFGLNTYFISFNGEPDRAELNSAFLLQQAVGLGGMAIVMGYLAPASANWYLKDTLWALMLCAGIGAYLNSFQSVPLAMLEQRMRYARVGLVEVVEILSFNAVAVFFVYIGWGVYGLAAGFVARGLFPALLAIKLSGIKPGFTNGGAKVFFCPARGRQCLGQTSYYGQYCLPRQL